MPQLAGFRWRPNGVSAVANMRDTAKLQGQMKYKKGSPCKVFCE